MQLTDTQKERLRLQMPYIEDEMKARINLLAEQKSSAKAVGDISRARLAGEKASETMYKNLGVLGGGRAADIARQILMEALRRK